MGFHRHDEIYHWRRTLFFRPKNVPIKPGGTGEIEVNFDTNGRPDLQQKMVKVSANTPTGGQLLRIQAFVEPKIN